MSMQCQDYFEDWSEDFSKSKKTHACRDTEPKRVIQCNTSVRRFQSQLFFELKTFFNIVNVAMALIYDAQ